MNRISKQAVDKLGKTIPEDDWEIHAVAWIVLPTLSMVISFGIVYFICDYLLR